MAELTSTAESRRDYLFDTSHALPPSGKRHPQQQTGTTKRSMTPRGQIFPDLQDAHRNITSRLASNNPYRDKTQHRDTLDDEDDEDDIYSSPGLTAASSSLADRTDSSLPLGVPVVQPPENNDAHEDHLPPSQRMASGRSLTDVHRHRRGQASDTAKEAYQSQANTNNNAVTGATAAINSEHKSGSTVEKIYEQYADPAHDDGSSSIISRDSDAAAYILSATSRNAGQTATEGRDGAITRFDFRDVSDGQKNNKRSIGTFAHKLQPGRRGSPKRKEASRILPRLRRRSSSLLRPPAIALPERPERAGGRTVSDTSADVDTRRGSSSITDSQHLLDAEAQIRELQLARPSTSCPEAGAPNKDVYAQAADNNDDWISDTQSSLAGSRTEDLFKYDNKSYREHLRPIKERDVSTALNGVGGFDVSDHEDGMDRRLSGSDYQVSSLSDSSSWNDVGSGFFDPAAVKSLASAGQGPRDIRVIIKGRPQNSTGDPEILDQVGELRENGRKYDFHPETLAREETHGGDWVTVATSNFDRDSKTEDALFGGGLKMTGSSIANYSDEADFANHPADPFGSERVLQHPPYGEAKRSFYARDNKDTQRPVLLPGRRKSKRGFPLNSLRGLAEDRYGRSSLISSALAKPFASATYSRADDDGHFVTSANHGPSKYEFRDSMSEYTPALASNMATDGSDTPGTHAVLPDLPATADVCTTTRYTATPAFEPRWRTLTNKDIDQGGPCSFEGSEASAMNSDFQFGFELLPLGNARKKHGARQDSGNEHECSSPPRPAKASRRPSFPFRSAANAISPPAAARLRDASSNWHTCSTPRGMYQPLSRLQTSC